MPPLTDDGPAAAEIGRLRAALRVAERHLADVQRVAGLCSWQSGLDAGNAHFSPEAWRVLCIDPALGPIDWAGLLQRVHPDDLPLLRADRTRMLRGEASVTTRFRFRRDDGSSCWLESRVSLVPARAGEPAGIVGILRDVSDSMRTRQELERHRERLEDLVVSRTVQLARASERVEAAGRARSAFVAHTSHEIRTPLNVIASLSHLMQHGQTDSTQLGRMQAVEQAARHLGSIIDDLLELAHAEGSPLALRSGPLRPALVLGEVALMLQPQAAALGLRIEVEPHALDPALRLRGDAARLRQAVLDAGRWALGQARGGDIRLRVSAGPLFQGRVALRLEVDFVAQAPAPVFDPDADADLASLRRLSALLGGDCGLQTGPDGTCRCWCTALLDADEVPDPGREPPLDGAAAQLRQRHAGRRVLVAEDDDVNQMVMLELLQDVGLLADTADDGQQAVQRAAQRPYALVCMDLRMPRMDGLAAARAMRSMPALDGTPIVAITANAFEEDRAACRAAGMNDFLPKPIDVGRLYELLLHWLDRSPSDPAGPAPLPVSASPTAPASSAPPPSPPPSSLPPPERPVVIDDALSSLVGLEGVDVLGGLDSVGGRAATYRRLLGVFIDGHHGDGEDLLQSLQAGDAAAAGRRVHRLRGSAATLGLVDVETAAAALEAAIDGDLGVEVLADLAAAVQGALGSTVPRLREALAR